MKTKAVERERVALLYAQGHTKKEISQITGKSIHTVGMQLRRYYEKTGSRNAADLTRFMVRRYSGIPVEDIIINALHDLTVCAFVAFMSYVIAQPETRDAVLGGFDSFIEILKHSFNKPAGKF